jgi:hypothetical protein
LILRVKTAAATTRYRPRVRGNVDTTPGDDDRRLPRRQLLPQRGTCPLVGLPSWKPGSRDIIHRRGKTEDMPPHDDGFRQPYWTLLTFRIRRKFYRRMRKLQRIMLRDRDVTESLIVGPAHLRSSVHVRSPAPSGYSPPHSLPRLIGGRMELRLQSLFLKRRTELHAQEA